MPDDERLDEIAAKIAGEGVTFASLPPEHRATVFALAVQSEISDSLYYVGRWFELSRLYEP